MGWEWYLKLLLELGALTWGVKHFQSLKFYIIQKSQLLIEPISWLIANIWWTLVNISTATNNTLCLTQYLGKTASQLNVRINCHPAKPECRTNNYHSKSSCGYHIFSCKILEQVPGTVYDELCLFMILRPTFGWKVTRMGFAMKNVLLIWSKWKRFCRKWKIKYWRSNGWKNLSLLSKIVITQVRSRYAPNYKEIIALFPTPGKIFFKKQNGILQKNIDMSFNIFRIFLKNNKEN